MISYTEIIRLSPSARGRNQPMKSIYNSRGQIQLAQNPKAVSFQIMLLMGHVTDLKTHNPI